MGKVLRAVRGGTIDPELLRALYSQGMTQRECAAEFGVARSEIHRSMVFYDIPRRPAIKRDQRGEKNPRWKGNDGNYKLYHKRVISARGKATSCDDCGALDAKVYDWANLTGRYEDIDDYKPLCRSCHQRHDGARRREAGIKRHKGRNANARR
jgi:hypothetical protein